MIFYLDPFEIFWQWNEYVTYYFVLQITDPPTDTTMFGVIQFWSPNSPYVALRSDQQHGGHNLYLSSNGGGHMKLKRWNKPIPESPFTTPEVDPALLFRVVRPLDQE
jgi:hypothetical protein